MNNMIGFVRQSFSDLRVIL